MKENAIKKINLMGRIGTIIVLVAKIFVSILIGLTVMGFIASLVLPSELCKVKIDGNAKVYIDLSYFDVTMTEEVKKGIVDGVNNNANINYAGNQFMVNQVETNDHGFDIDASASLTEVTIRDFAWALAGVFLYLALLLVSLIYTGRLTKSFRHCQSPFENEVIKRMKQFAYSLIPWAVISSVNGVLQQRIWMAGSNRVDLQININIVIIVLVILAFAYFFQYGAVLQKESDETL